MKHQPNKNVIAAYYRSYYDEPPYADSWGYSYVNELVSKNSKRAWRMVLSLINNAPNLEVLDYVGADCLEELLHLHGHHVLHRVSAEAKVNPRLKSALYIARINELYPFHQELRIIKENLGILHNRPTDEIRF